MCLYSEVIWHCQETWQKWNHINQLKSMKLKEKSACKKEVFFTLIYENTFHDIIYTNFGL